jgi:hypothetical protein
MDGSNVFNDMVEALHEVEEYQKGNLQLRSDVVEIPDENVIVKFNRLNENDKYFVSGMIDRLLIANK